MFAGAQKNVGCAGVTIVIGKPDRALFLVGFDYVMHIHTLSGSNPLVYRLFHTSYLDLI